jgi:hypothetical protein
MCICNATRIVAKGTKKKVEGLKYMRTTNCQWPTPHTKSLARFHRIYSYGF